MSWVRSVTDVAGLTMRLLAEREADKVRRTKDQVTARGANSTFPIGNNSLTSCKRAKSRVGLRVGLNEFGAAP